MRFLNGHPSPPRMFDRYFLKVALMFWYHFPSLFPRKLYVVSYASLLNRLNIGVHAKSNGFAEGP